MTLRVAFAGTPDFAAVALRSILAAGFEVPLVLTQPDRPAGRGLRLQPSPVKQLALEHGIPVRQPKTLRDPAELASLADYPVDIAVVAAYGLILPQAALDWPRAGCLNIHASLLPRWRGAAPIHRAIEAGDRETGVCIMQMEAGLDTGPVIRRAAIAIGPSDTTGSLHDRLATLGGEQVVLALHDLAVGGADRRLAATPQPEDGVTYAHKIEKAEAEIDWQLPAAVLERRIRAFDPFPGAVTHFRGEPLKVWAAAIGAGTEAAPGTIVAVARDSVAVACGEGSLALTLVQRAGGRRGDAGVWAGSANVAPGDRFTSIASGA